MTEEEISRASMPVGCFALLWAVPALWVYVPWGWWFFPAVITGSSLAFIATCVLTMRVFRRLDK